MTRGRMEEEEEHDDGEGSLQGASSWRSRWWLVKFIGKFFFFSLWGNDTNEWESVNKLNLLGGFGMIEISFDQSLFVYCWKKTVRLLSILFEETYFTFLQNEKVFVEI